MQNIKVVNNWEGDAHWTKIGHVTIKGDHKASNTPIGATQPDAEKTVQSWQQVAVLQANPVNDVLVEVINKDNPKYQDLPIY